MLKSLRGPTPLLAEALTVADMRRSARLSSLLDGPRLRGLEQLYAYLDAAVKAYAEIPAIAGVAFLIQRVKSDYKTALEATLSGYQGVAADAMRDVMEIEYLLLDFAASEDQSHAEEWLNAGDSLGNKYWPATVRTRLKRSGVPPFANDGFEPIDYKAHSKALHVNPGPSAVASRGPDPLEEPVPFYSELGFIEMFEHGHRILWAIELLRAVALGVPDDYEPLMARDDFDDAYERTRRLQVMMVGFIEGPTMLRERLGREPTVAEILGHVRDELAAMGGSIDPSDGEESV